MPRSPGGIEPTDKADYPASRGLVFKILILCAIWFVAFSICWVLAWISLLFTAVLMPDVFELSKRLGLQSKLSKHFDRRAIALLTMPRDALARDEQAAKDQPGLSPQARN